MRIDVIDTHDALRVLKENWDAVYETDPEAKFFLSWTWIAHWFERLKAPWFVLAAKPDGAEDYAAFFPLQIQTETAPDGHVFNRLRMGGFPVAEYTGFLCRPEIETEVSRAFAEYTKRYRWTTLQLNRFSESPARRRAFLQAFPKTEYITGKVTVSVKGDKTDYDMFLSVRLPGDWESFVAGLSANARKKTRRSLKAVEQSDTLRITHATAETIDRDIAILLRFWKIKWGGASNAKARLIENYGVMLRHVFDAGCLLLPILWENDKPLGAYATFIDTRKRALICFLGGRDLNVKTPPPGFVLDMHSIRWGIANGFAVYDFLQGNHLYKYDFEPEERPIHGLWIGTQSRLNREGLLDPLSLSNAFDQASALYNAGKIALAERGLRQILETGPQHECAHTLLRRIESSRPPLPGDAFERAYALHGERRLDDAADAYLAILAAEPRHIDAANLLGVLYLQQGQYEAAERQLRYALTLHSSAAIYSNLGSALQNQQRYEEALECYDAAIERQPDYPEAYNNRANTLLNLKRPEEALESYDRAIALKPDYAEAFSNRSSALMELGRALEALEACDTAIALAPRNANAFSNRAAALKKLGRLEEALASYDSALSLKPDFRHAYTQRSALMQMMAQHDSAAA